MHRDLKLENMLLDEDGNIKLSDFGCATFHHSTRQGAGRLANCTTTCGSPNYIAPEMLRCPTYDAALADVWSCGVILFALLTGHLPFAVSDDASDQGNAHLFKQIVAGCFEKPVGISPACDFLLSGILQVDPAVRYNVDMILSDGWYCVSPPPSPTQPEAHALIASGKGGSDGGGGRSVTPVEGSPACSDGSSSLMSPMQQLRKPALTQMVGVGGGGGGGTPKRSLLIDLAEEKDGFAAAAVAVPVPDAAHAVSVTPHEAKQPEEIPPLVNAFELLSMCSHMTALRLGCALSSPTSMHYISPDGKVCQPPVALAAMRAATTRAGSRSRPASAQPRKASTSAADNFDSVSGAALPHEPSSLAPLVRQSSCFVAAALPSDMLQSLQEALLATVKDTGGSKHSCSCTVFEDRAEGASTCNSLAFFWTCPGLLPLLNQAQQHSRAAKLGGGGGKQVGLEATFRSFPSSVAIANGADDCDAACNGNGTAKMGGAESMMSPTYSSTTTYLIRLTHVHGDAAAFVNLCDAFVARGGIPGMILPGCK